MLREGTVLRARYRIIRQIGAGGTGCVYLAEDFNIGKMWAVKQILYRPGISPALGEHEVLMMKQLDYWIFPRIVDAWQEEQCYFIVSDYIDGVSLDCILKQGAVPAKVALGWTIVLAKALRYLHEGQPPIWYLDLKPDNIMVRPDGTISLIDFGIAQRLAEPAHQLGTPGFAAPEQYGCIDMEIDARTDIFALGMTLYAMLSGQTPVPNLAAQTVKVQDSGLKKNVKKVILHCIQSNPKKRFQNTQELLPALYQIQEGHHSFKKLIITGTFGLLIFVLLLFALVWAGGRQSENAAARQMLSEIGNHVVDGEYTKEGIQIICGYLDSGCLNPKTASQFTYEVAYNLFEQQRNYKEAGHYFNKLNSGQYPDAAYFLKLCRLQTEFEENGAEIEDCLMQFYRYNCGEPFSEKKCENELLIAVCYEQHAEVIEGAEEKAAQCLEKGIEVLFGECILLEENFRQTEELKEQRQLVIEMQAEYARRLCLLYEEIGNKEKMCIYGELALELLPKHEAAARADITDRIEGVKNRKPTKGEGR